jgi:hypothetical protein
MSVKANNHEEYVFEPSDPKVGLGTEAVLNGQNPKNTQIPAQDIKADVRGELEMRRDQPIYNEGSNEPDEELHDGTWIKAFKAGTHTDADNVTHKWDISKIKMIAQQYNDKVSANNPERHVAPVVIGHPDDKSPAWAWIEKAKAVKDKLWLKITDVQPEFAEAVNRGMYKMRSISLYPDLGIRHLGFLGGAPPAVKGLVPYKFSATNECETYEFGESMEDINAIKKENSFFKNLFAKFKMEVSDFNDGSAPGEILSQEKPTVETLDGKFPKGATMADKNISKLDHAKYAKSYAAKGKSFLDPEAIKGVSGIDISAKLSEFAKLAMMHHSATKDDGDTDDDADKEWKNDECSYSSLFDHITKMADDMIPDKAITSGNYSAGDGDAEINEPKRIEIPASEESDKLVMISELQREVSELKAELSRLETLNEKLMTEAEEDQSKAAMGEFSQFCDSLVASGQLPPWQVPMTIENLKLRAELDKAQAHNYAEGKTRQPPENKTQEYKDYLESMPKTMDFNELLVGSVPEQKVSNFVENEIAQVQKDMPGTQYVDALNIVRAKSSDHAEKVDNYMLESFKQ